MLGATMTGLAAARHIAPGARDLTAPRRAASRVASSRVTTPARRPSRNRPAGGVSTRAMFDRFDGDAVTAVNRLIYEDEAAFIVGPLGSAPLAAWAPSCSRQPWYAATSDEASARKMRA